MHKKSKGTTKYRMVSGFAHVLILIALVIILGVLTLGWLANHDFFDTRFRRPRPSPDTITASPKPTANWKTYTNSSYGYSVEYPPMLEFNNEIQSLNRDKLAIFQFSNNGNSSNNIFITVSESQSDKDRLIEARENYQTMEKLKKEYASYSEQIESSFPFTIKIVTVDQTEAYQVTTDTENTRGISTLIDKNNLLYDISLQTDNISVEFEEVYDQILSTFRFLE
ncbi:hypothetical protein A3H21_04845 [Candidatus Woesebacteria bacterium RIFCSPLOWO2_12_FULL_42_8]|nr:MAG: hypothetical protein A3H21_04845 [Candidatus Woesebacteria bacterium RIFCSPLOWO2_12_FULL_42_8]